MPPSFISHFAPDMPDEVTITPGAVDYTNTFIASGTEIVANCRIEGSQRMSRTPGGVETLSTHQLYLDGYYDLDPATHRFTLPARYSPREKLEAISVQKVSDEAGPVFEVVYLP